MKVIYQGKEAETEASNLADFLAEKELNSAELVIEFNDEVLAGKSGQLQQLNSGDRINIFRIVAGG